MATSVVRRLSASARVTRSGVGLLQLTGTAVVAAVGPGVVEELVVAAGVGDPESLGLAESDGVALSPGVALSEGVALSPGVGPSDEVGLPLPVAAAVDDAVVLGRPLQPAVSTTAVSRTAPSSRRDLKRLVAPGIVRSMD